MSQDNLIKMECTVCKHVNYHTTKNKKTHKARREANKHCPHCVKHVAHKETK